MESVQLEEMVKEIHEALLGTYDKKGLIGRVTRLEEFVCRISKFGWIVVAAVASSTVGVVFALIKVAA
jgi:hypothetical protein